MQFVEYTELLEGGQNCCSGKAKEKSIVYNGSYSKSNERSDWTEKDWVLKYCP